MSDGYDWLPITVIIVFTTCSKGNVKQERQNVKKNKNKKKDEDALGLFVTAAFGS